MTDRDSKTKISGFGRVMIIYAAVFIAALILLLLFFNIFLQKYEESRPAYAVSSYIDTFSADKAKELLGKASAKINTDVQTEDESAAELEAILKRSVYVKNRSESTDDCYSYYLEDDDVPILHFLLTQSDEKGLFGFRKWSVNSEELAEENIFHSDEYEIPADYTISCNGRTLGESFKSEGLSSYKMLAGFSEEFNDLPRLNLYNTGPYLGNVDIKIHDSSGNEISEDAIEEGFYCLDNCTEDEKAALKDFCETFVTRYVNYTSGADGNLSGDLVTLLSMVDKSTVIYDRISDSLGGMAYVTSYDEIKDISINHYMNCGDGRYCCDITYQVETTSSHGTTYNEYGYKLLIRQQDSGSYLVIGMSVE